jgi:WD40 repeat protein/DNA polymerase III delta prime subunit
MSSKAAVLRVVPLLRLKLSQANALRLDETLKLINDEGKAVLASVLNTLYPRQPRERALTSFRQFRQEVARAAEAAGVELLLETDGQTRSLPQDRVVWFQAEDRITEEVKRMVESEVADVERSPQDIQVLPTARFFVSYAREDADLKKKFLSKLQILLATHARFQFELWTDGEILPGKEWLTEIQKAMEGCDFGLLLVSPAFLASKFITTHELPHLLQSKPAIPVALKPVLFDGSQNLKGLEQRQIFFDESGHEFSRQKTNETQDRFVRQLFQKIDRLLSEAPQPAKTQPAKVDARDHAHLARLALAGFDEERFVPTEGVMTTIVKDLEGPPEIDSSQRKDAVKFLEEWATDVNAPPYCALLGEYGMGKTTTCKALARELLHRHDQGETVPLPIYLDLRNVGAEARRGLVLEEILELVLKYSWKAGPGSAALSATELIGLVQNQGALVIWDGLDEVLVHLEPDPGQKFTRQLFRILPPARKGERRPGRMLISCRTHYFRTLRDQQNHFRAEGRDNLRTEHFRPPFVLLPFSPDQVRHYLELSLPEEDPQRVMDLFKSVHNLEEMAERPYTLSLITRQFTQIERWKAEGKRVTGLMLYRHMVLSWLERDQGKHQFTTDHKQALMEYFAAELWRSGARFWSVSDLEQWLIDFLRQRPDLAAHYEGKDRELLKEDLRTATFLVREGDDRFRFAHTSLQEYFLAGYLRRALVEGRPESWNLPAVSPETLEFLGQWLHEEGRRDAALRTLESLRDTYRPRASELAFAYFLLAARKGYASPSPSGFQLPGADLTGWEIAGKPGEPLMLAGINLRGARLWNSRWRDCNLQEAIFDGADASRAEWLNCHLTQSAWREAQLEATVYRDCALAGANFEGSRPQAMQLLRCGVSTARGLPPGRSAVLYAPCAEDPVLTSVRLRVLDGHRSPVMGCAWAPDNVRLVSASYDHTLRIWDSRTGQSLATLSGHQRTVFGCAWSPDGQRILSASSDNTLRIWDARSGQSLATLSGHGDSVFGCAWSPDGQRILSASSDNTLRIWDARSGQSLVTLSGHQDDVWACAWSPDGQRLVSASKDNTLRIWDAFSGQSLATLSGHQSSVMGCAWSPDSLRLVSASEDQTLRIWDANSGQSLVTLSDHPGMVWGCAWSPNGLYVLSASADRMLCIWDARSSQSLATLSGHQGAVRGCAWSPNGLRLASASYDNTLRIWDARSGQSLVTLSGHQSSVTSCAWSPDGLRLVSASYDDMLRIWDAHSGQSLAILSGHQHSVTGCVWSPDGLRLLSASTDTTLRIWDARSGQSLAILSGHQSSVTGCAWSPDGLRLLSASDDKTLRIWDARSGQSLAILSGHQSSVTGCAWSPDGQRILSASWDKTLRIWDARSGQPLANLSGHQHSVRCCAWSPDGLRILSASDDRTLRIWDARSGQLLANLSGHQHSVRGCAWSPDGLRILSASDDRTLRIWDARSGQPLANLSGHQSHVTACAWSPDERRILSASHDGTLGIWDAETGIRIAPEIHHLRAPHSRPSWCSIDPQQNRILACDSEAWRSLGWVVPDRANGLPELLPAETFGPLPTQ